MASDKLIDVLREYQRKYLSEIGKGIKKYDIVGSGALGTSLRIGKQPKVKLFGKTYVMRIEAEPYWEQINYGRDETKNGGDGSLRKNLEEWLRYPNVRQKITSGGKGKYDGGSDSAWDDAKYKSVAWAMATKIHKEGYEARPFVTEARDKIDKAMLKAVGDAALEQAEITIDQIITFINDNK